MDIIIGAGVSGLSYASFTKNDYLVLEQESEIGGYCRTIKQDGFVWDYAGHFFHFRDEELKRVVTQYIDANVLRTVDKRTQIIYKNRYIDFPFQKNIHQLPKEEFIDCLYDLFNIEDGIEIKTFKDMIYANLGKSISDKFLIPYNQKLYACNLNNLDKDAMGRFFPKSSREDIINNFRNPQVDSYNNTFVYPEGGAIEYINSIYKQVDSSKVLLGEKVIRIDRELKIVYTNNGEFKYDNLINTSPFNKLLDSCDIGYSEDVFSWNKVLVFNLGFDSKGSDITNSWLYIPDSEVVFYRVGYYDNIMGTDRMSLYAEIGFNRDECDIDIDKYLIKVLNDLKAVGIVNEKQQLISHNVVLMDPAYVHIDKKSDSVVSEMKELLKQSNIYSIGRYGSWTYCSIEDNIIEGRDLSVLLSR